MTLDDTSIPILAQKIASKTNIYLSATPERRERLRAEIASELRLMRRRLERAGYTLTLTKENSHD